VSRNRLHAVELMQSACGGSTGTAILHSRGSESMNTLYPRDLLRSSFRDLTSVPVLTLDDLFETFRIQCSSLLKLDCEGSE
jgi:FkbM family methyltransferase